MGKRLLPSNESYYDLFDDWELIESSFLKQYGIRIRQDDDMSWSEFCSLLSGIMPNTPLGQIVSIRAEKDQKVIREFTKEQRKIRNDWIKKCNAKSRKNNDCIEMWKGFQDWARTNF